MPALFLWRELFPLPATPSSLARRLETGCDDVEGLADLSIREMIDQLQMLFPGGKEAAGVWTWKSNEQSLQASWTWQYMRFEVEQLTDDNREKIFEFAAKYSCSLYDPILNLRWNAQDQS
jgi:hypothetical protein